MAVKITRLGVAGFKSAMAPVHVNIRDITVLAGQNSAGKSTIIQPALMIKQTMEKSFDPGGLAIDGPLVKFTNAVQFLRGPSGNAKDRVKLEIFIASEKEDFSIMYDNLRPGRLTPSEMHFQRNVTPNRWIEGQEVSSSDQYIELRGALIHNDPMRFDKLKVIRNRCWLEMSFQRNFLHSEGAYLGGINPVTFELQSIAGIIYLPGLRGTPERDYPISATGPDFPGNFADYVASIIHSWETAKDGRLEMLGGHLRRLGLTSRVTTKQLDDTRVEIRVGRLPIGARGGARDTVSIADVGIGVSQTLPVLVALLVAQRDQIVFIEQPEIHLHPRAQAGLADLIVEAADRGVRVIIETHSSLLLAALQTLIVEQKIDAAKVSFNWFTRGKNGQTEVTEAELRPDGSYGDWPVDFGSVELAAQNRYLDSVDAYREAKEAVG